MAQAREGTEAEDPDTGNADAEEVDEPGTSTGTANRAEEAR